MMSARALHAPKVEQMLAARLEVLDVEETDDFLSIDDVPGIGGPARRRRRQRGRVGLHAG